MKFLKHDGEQFEVRDAFYWNGVWAIHPGNDTGWTLLDPSDFSPVEVGDIATLSDAEVLARFPAEEGKFFYGDSGFNAALAAISR